jgi:hypothetical protein
MQRDILLLTEMIDAAEQAQQLAAGVTVDQLEDDRQRRDALLWNFTVLGEAAGQLSAEIRAKSPTSSGDSPSGLGTGSSMATGLSTSTFCGPRQWSSCPRLSRTCTLS